MELIVAALLGYLGSTVVCIWMSNNAEAMHLVQAPNFRSSHVNPTPTAGGLGFVTAASAVGLILVPLHSWSSGLLLVSLSAILAAVGLRDDIRHVPAFARFGTQALVTFLFLTLAGIHPVVRDGLLGNLAVPSWVLVSLLFFAWMWWINLFNFMDGIDGLAGSQAVFMLVFAALASLYFQPTATSDPIWVFMIVTASAVFGFLVLNWPPARIFMGDVGSTWLAFVTFALGLLALDKGWLNLASCIILPALFVVDATVTLLSRALRGESWHEAHRSHAYQKLSRRWKQGRKSGHLSVTLLFMFINLVWIGPLAWASLLWPNWWAPLFLAAYSPLVFASLWVGSGKPDAALAEGQGEGR